MKQSKVTTKKLAPNQMATSTVLDAQMGQAMAELDKIDGVDLKALQQFQASLPGNSRKALHVLAGDQAQDETHLNAQTEPADQQPMLLAQAGAGNASDAGGGATNNNDGAGGGQSGTGGDGNTGIAGVAPGLGVAPIALGLGLLAAGGGGGGGGGGHVTPPPPPVAPTLLITDNQAGTLNHTNHTVTFTFTFSKAVTGFVAGDIVFTYEYFDNGTLHKTTLSPSDIATYIDVSALTGSGTTYQLTVDVDPSFFSDFDYSVGSATYAGGVITVSVANGVAIDTDGLYNTGDTHSQLMYETTGFNPPHSITITAISDNVDEYKGDFLSHPQIDGNVSNNKFWINDATPVVQFTINWGSSSWLAGDTVDIVRMVDNVPVVLGHVTLVNGTNTYTVELSNIGPDGHYGDFELFAVLNNGSSLIYVGDAVQTAFYLDTVAPDAPTIDSVTSQDPGSKTTGPVQVVIHGQVEMVLDSDSVSPVTNMFAVLTDWIGDGVDYQTSIIDPRTLNFGSPVDGYADYTLKFDAKLVPQIGVYAIQTAAYDEAGNGSALYDFSSGGVPTPSDSQTLEIVVFGINQKGSGDLLDLNNLYTSRGEIAAPTWFDPDDNATIFAFDGQDTVISGNGNDLIYGGMGKDLLRGMGGNDTIYGGDGTENSQDQGDTLEGGAGNDWLYGETQGDSISGGADDDWIFGGSGTDTLSGGTGKDQFVFGNQPTKLTSGDADLITDFSAADDKVVLVANNTNFTALKDLTTLTAAQFSASGSVTADTRIVYVDTGNNIDLYYDADGSGSGTAVLFATLENINVGVGVNDLKYTNFSIIA